MNSTKPNRKTTDVSPGEILSDELSARGWTNRDLAKRMEGDTDQNHCIIDLMIFAPNKSVFIAEDTSANLGKALGVSPKFFLKLDAMWRAPPPGGQDA